MQYLPRPAVRLLRLLLVLALVLAGWAGVAGSARAAGLNDRIKLLVPDDAVLTSWQVQVWTDSAAEEGVLLEVIRDSAFIALGNGAASTIAGLIVPDSAHIKASPALVAAIKQYAFLGGRVMLVYDAGSLDQNGAFPVTGNSRFADMVGVDYVLWNNGAGIDTMVGFGPIVGTAARLERLSLAPGKYLPYTPPATALASSAATAAGARSTAGGTAAYVPVSPADPGGSLAMAPAFMQRALQPLDEGSASVRAMRSQALRQLLGVDAQPMGPVTVRRKAATAVSPALDGLLLDRVPRRSDAVAARLDPAQNLAVAEPAVADPTLQAISAYGYGALNYYSYTTSGTFPGTVLLASPDHGLAAGVRAWGSGQVLFVNMPIGYFKAIGSDSVLLHGFINLFARDHVGLMRLSVQPKARGSLIYNWHVDDGDDLTADTVNLLQTTNILQKGPYSIHFTAGPDVITPGDGKGMKLATSATAQALVRQLRDLPIRHELGSHGGWIHDYYGLNANEANVPDFTSYLTQNFAAIENTIGRTIREYSAPVGNNPGWAVRWLENRGVVAFYTVSDGGAAIRPWRNGARLTSNRLWAFPVSPQGRYATFEEFDRFGVTDAQSTQWLLDMQSFVVNNRTNRLFYNHPPGARGHIAAIQPLINRADTLAAQGSFQWITMAALSDFQQRRLNTRWTSTYAAPLTTVVATNTSGLTDMAWLLPRNRYAAPTITAGLGTVTYDSEHWIVTGTGGTSLTFTVGNVTLPALATSCAAQGGTCTIPAGATATVYYGSGGQYIAKTGVSGAVTCDSTTFGDPNPGVAKSCFVMLSYPLPAGAVSCAAENAVCRLPVDAIADVYFGTSAGWLRTGNVVGSLACTTANFGDPARGVVKSCYYVRTGTVPASGTGLLAQYHTNPTLTGTPLVSRTETPYFAWNGASPAPGVAGTNFSARWTGFIEGPDDGPATLQTNSDNGVRVWFDGKLVIDNWTPHAATLNTADVTMAMLRRYPVTIEYYQVTGGSTLQLSWKVSGGTSFVPVPTNRLYPATAISTTNVAAAKPALQSSTANGGVATRAVDGNTSGVFAQNSVTHTDPLRTQPWWQVDLGASRRIDRVQLWNRTDCCGDRLQNFTVFVSGSDMSTRTLADLQADATVIKRTVGATAVVNPFIAVPVGDNGRYVRVQLTGTQNVLSLAEVQVFGAP